MCRHQDGTFHRAVEKAFGKENVTVVASAEGGKPIRAWDKDYKLPEERVRQNKERLERKGREPMMFGYRYDALLKKLEEETTGKKGHGITEAVSTTAFRANSMPPAARSPRNWTGFENSQLL